MGSPFRRLLYAVKFHDQQILLSSYINKDSRILYDRSPRARVQKAAPWLTLDGDPYPAVIDGRITWILDGYTTSSGYPYSTGTTLGSATVDSTNTTSQVVAQQPETPVNYIRNSVKATVDAYDGTVTLYAWDPTDPVLQTWMKAFPGTVKPRSAMSADLLAHIRYPEDLFNVQRYVYAHYHVTDPASFYNQQDFWQIPDDPTKSLTSEPQPPYYLTLQMPGTSSASFSLTTTYAPNNRQTLAAFMAVDSDAGPDYGTIRVLRLPRNTTIPGPTQVQNNFESDTTVSSQLTLLRQGGSSVTFGNLLSLPVAGGILYVEPVYVSASGTGLSYPLLRKVLVGFGNNVGFQNTLAAAVNQVFNVSGTVTGPTTTTPTSPTTPSTPGTTSGSAAALAKALADVQLYYQQGQAALRRGDFAAYGTAQSQLAAAIARAQKAAQELALAAPTTSKASATSKTGSTPKPTTTASTASLTTRATTRSAVDLAAGRSP